VLKYFGRMFLAKVSVECNTSNPRRHSTIPESFSDCSISWRRRTNLLSRRVVASGKECGKGVAYMLGSVKERGRDLVMSTKADEDVEKAFVES
jgi:hypothetical protein